MGTRTTPRYVMEWQSDLKSMKAHGTLVTLGGCKGGTSHWVEQDLDQLIKEMGEDGSLWDLRPSCPRCLTLQHFLASPGPSTPYRPLLSGLP
jgi:hypothetical protein